MRRIVAVAFTVGTLAYLSSVRTAASGEPATKPAASAEVVMPAADMKWKDVIPGVTQSVLWGDPDTGAYGAITRFKAGVQHKLHTHENDIKIIVISGTLTYQPDGGEMKKLGPGSYLVQPAGKKHMSGAGPEADCVFVQQSSGKFTLTFVEEKPAAKK